MTTLCIYRRLYLEIQNFGSWLAGVISQKYSMLQALAFLGSMVTIYPVSLPTAYGPIYRSHVNIVIPCN
jgi:hypothetical protein